MQMSADDRHQSEVFRGKHSRTERSATWICQNCRHEINPDAKTCPNCGSDLAKQHRVDYEAKLIRPLEHRLDDRGLIAARVLGQIGGIRAVRALIKLAKRDGDPYASAEAVRALARNGGSEATAYLERAGQHRSAVVRHAARKAPTT